MHFHVTIHWDCMHHFDQKLQCYVYVSTLVNICMFLLVRGTVSNMFKHSRSFSPKRKNLNSWKMLTRIELSICNYKVHVTNLGAKTKTTLLRFLQRCKYQYSVDLTGSE